MIPGSDVGFGGQLAIKVIRAKPSLWVRIMDFLKGRS
jgi:hypothetical protein